jgi:hypothetical protein
MKSQISNPCLRQAERGRHGKSQILGAVRPIRHLPFALCHIFPLLLITSCASVTQTARTAIDPATGIETRDTRTRILATGDAKQTIEHIRSTNGKTHSLGASGVAEETTSTALIELLRLILTLQTAK